MEYITIQERNHLDVGRPHRARYCFDYGFAGDPAFAGKTLDVDSIQIPVTMDPPTTQTSDGDTLPTDGGENSKGSSSDDDQNDNADGGENDPSNGGLPAPASVEAVTSDDGGSGVVA